MFLEEIANILLEKMLKMTTQHRWSPLHVKKYSTHRKHLAI